MERILELVESVPELPREQIFWTIDHACRVDKSTFKILTITLGVLAILSSVMRMVLRYSSAQTLNLGDYIILFATTCLIAEMALVLSFTDSIYQIDGATLGLPILKYVINDGELRKTLLNPGSSILIAYLTLGWLAIFAVKFSFLALFYKMSRNVNRKLTAFYWVTVAMTGMSAVVVILESFILCASFGADATQCFLEVSYTISISSGVVVQSLDIATDLMIISIPLTLLKMSQLKFHSKVRVATVLCLSSICVILSVVRLAAGMHRNVFGKWQFGMAWITFMLHCEAATAVLASSMPALRAVYTSHRSRKSETHIDTEKDQDSLQGKASCVLGSLRLKQQQTLPKYEHPQQTSIAKWRQSVAGVVPRRAASTRRVNLDKVRLQKLRCSATESIMIHPTLAYHNIRKQEKDWVQSGLRIPLGISSNPENSDLAVPARTMSTRRIDYFIDTQLVSSEILDEAGRVGRENAPGRVGERLHNV